METQIGIHSNDRYRVALDGYHRNKLWRLRIESLWRPWVRKINCTARVTIAVVEAKMFLIWGNRSDCKQKDTRVFNDDVPRSFVEHHLIEDVDNLTHKLIVLLLDWEGNRKTSKFNEGHLNFISSWSMGGTELLFSFVSFIWMLNRISIVLSFSALKENFTTVPNTLFMSKRNSQLFGGHSFHPTGLKFGNEVKCVCVWEKEWGPIPN